MRFASGLRLRAQPTKESGLFPENVGTLPDLVRLNAGLRAFCFAFGVTRVAECDGRRHDPPTVCRLR